ncbi:MAG TPA: hypothetical protein VIV66_07425 [Pyrinomonadaceae bacterium]
MSDIKLNLIDSQTILSGTIHGSTADRCVAALSAEPETITELEAALERFQRSSYRFTQLFKTSYLDPTPYDAGILTIDLAARIIACDSTYSQPSLEGSVQYHNGKECTDTWIPYRLPHDWLFVDSIEQYECVRNERRNLRSSPLDAREVVYGSALLMFIATNVLQSPGLSRNCKVNRASSEHTESEVASEVTNQRSEDDGHPLAEFVREIHRRWLLTPRDDLRGESPRGLLLAKQEFINLDVEHRSWQWSMLLEGPPGLDRNAFAYRYAGFGTHEWVIYYDLVRHLIRSAVDLAGSASEQGNLITESEMVLALEQLESAWLNEPNDEFEGVPINIIDNERRRIPEAMGGRSMVVDEDCPVCKMMGDESEAGLGVYFWHLDGCNMDDEFAFSTFGTSEEWESDQREREERHKEFDRKWKEREERIARGETLDPDPFFDPPELDEFVSLRARESEPPVS